MILVLAIVIPNAVGFLYTWRRVAYAIAWDFGTPDMEDRVMGLLLGMLAACVWPFALGFMVIARNDGFFLPPRDKRREVREREQDERIRELERRNAQLERELGVGA